MKTTFKDYPKLANQIVEVLMYSGVNRSNIKLDAEIPANKRREARSIEIYLDCATTPLCQVFTREELKELGQGFELDMPISECMAQSSEICNAILSPKYRERFSEHTKDAAVWLTNFMESVFDGDLFDVLVPRSK